MPVLVRVQTRIGQARVSVESGESLAQLAQKVQEQLPGLQNFKLSRDRGHKDYLAPADATVAALGLQHGDMIFADHEAKADPQPPVESPAKTQMVGNSLSGTQVVETMEGASPARPSTAGSKKVDVPLHEVDMLLAKMEGREKLKETTKRGFGDSSIDSMAVEPYDDRLLKEKGLKLMSFHAYLRKLNSISGGGKFSELKRHDFGSYGEMGGKGGQEKGWGSRAVSMSRIPKPMTLNRQKYRHVDRVEIEAPEILDKFLDAWRHTGGMRYGFMYGTYEHDPNVPLGIKAVVKAIYEPPQECAADGVNILEDPNDEIVEKTAALLGLCRVGWIFLDLEVMAEDSTKYVCTRNKDTYFLRSNECVLAAHFQNKYPSPCQECQEGIFGSKFVTVVVTGNDKNELDYVAYQVSQQGMDLEKAEGILEWTSKPDRCRVTLSSQDRYVPAIFYQDVSEFGNTTTHEAKPYFPVDYLVVSVNGPTFPEQSDPMFRVSFPIENRMLAPQDMNALRSHLNNPENKPFRPTGQLKTLSDIHLIVYLAIYQSSILSLHDPAEGFKPLCDAVMKRDSSAAAQVMQSPAWMNLLAIAGASSDSNESRPGTAASAAGAAAMESDGFGEFGTGARVRPPSRVGSAAGSRPGTSGGASSRFQNEAEQLAAMGFDKSRALEILDIVNGNLETAIEMLSG